MTLERFKAYDLQEKMKQEWGNVPEVETGKGGFAHLLVALGMAEKGQLARGEKSTVNEVVKGKIIGVEGGGGKREGRCVSPMVPPSWADIVLSGLKREMWFGIPFCNICTATLQNEFIITYP